MARKRSRQRFSLPRLFKGLAAKGHTTLDQPQLADALAYLQFFGDVGKEPTVDDLRAAIRRVQTAARRLVPNLKVDSILGPVTKRALDTLPRCNPRQELKVERAAGRDGGTWGAKPVTFFVRDAVPGFSVNKVSDQVRRAADECERVCGLKFKRTTSESSANLILRAQRIDGPGRTLGVHDIVPSRGYSGTLRGEIDTREPWTEDLLFRVILHEVFWHGIGQFHYSGRGRSIGEPFLWNYTGYTETDADILSRKNGLPGPISAPDTPIELPRKVVKVNGHLVYSGVVDSIELS